MTVKPTDTAMKHLLSVTAAAILAAICLFSCEREIMPPITGVSFQMDSVFFYGSDPELVIRSKSKGVEATLSITVDGTDAFCNGEPYAIGEDGCDTIRIDTGLGVGEHTVRALALGCCGRYIQEDFTFRVLPSLEAASTNIFQTGIPVQPLILRMQPASYIGQTTVKEADDAVLMTETVKTRDGFNVMPTLRSAGTTSMKFICLGHTYDVPLECRDGWAAAVKALDEGDIESL